MSGVGRNAGMVGNDMGLDVLTVGEALLRLSVPSGLALDSAHALDLTIGGSEANTATALAGLGRSVVWFSSLPTSSLGRRVARELRGSGVDVSYVTWVEEGRLGTYYVEQGAQPRPISVLYDRRGSTAAEMSTEDFPWHLVETAGVVHITGITPSLSSRCRDLIERLADDARRGRCRLSVDVNYRAKLWAPADAKACLSRIARSADLVIMTHEDARDVFGFSGPPQEVAAQVLHDLEAQMAVVTSGPDGCAWMSVDDSGLVPALSTVVVDSFGAGDAFAAGAIDGLLDGDLERGLRNGAILGSLALTTHGDHITVTRAELDRVASGNDRDIDR